MARAAWMLESLLMLNSGGFVDGLLDTARKQAQPRRWPWQQKTLRDRLNEYGEDVTNYAKLQGDTLLKIVQEQSRPRRWPWQQRTLRDLLDARTEEFAELAAAQSAVLAQAVAQRRDELLDSVRKQAQPRRWPWQQKTARDRLNERSAQLASVAAERSAQLAALAAARRDALVSEARRQAQPSRWPWQSDTLRDKLDARTGEVSAAATAQSAKLKSAASNQYDAAMAQGSALADAAAQQKDALLREARRQSQPRRWPWQQKTAYDRALEQRDALTQAAADRYSSASERAKDLKDRSGKTLRKSADNASDYVQQAKDVVPGVLGAATAATSLLKDNAKSARDSVGASASSAGASLKDTARNVGSSISSTAEDAADAVQSAVNKPVQAVNSGVKATKRTARWSRRLFRTALWAVLAGIVIGMLAAPESGQEMRKHLQAAFDQLSRSVQGGGSGTATQI